MQAPLLAYTHFVEAIYVMNGCRAGLVGVNAGGSVAAAEGADALTLLATPGSGTSPRLLGDSVEARSNRDVVYRCTCVRHIG